MKFPRFTKPLRNQFEFAPYASVLFVLLMLIALSSQLVHTPGVAIRLPQIAGLPGISGPTVVVAVDASGLLFFDGQVIEEAALKEALIREVRRATTPLTLIIEADKDTRNEVSLRLATLAGQTGFQEAVLAVRPPLPGGPPIPP